MNTNVPPIMKDGVTTQADYQQVNNYFQSVIAFHDAAAKYYGYPSWDDFMKSSDVIMNPEMGDRIMRLATVIQAEVHKGQAELLYEIIAKAKKQHP